MLGKLPKVDFLSVILQRGAEYYKKYDNPHIKESEQTSASSSEVNDLSSINDENSETMRSDVIAMVQIPFSMSSINMYSIYEEQNAKYMRIKVVQSTNHAISKEIASHPLKWLKPFGLLDKNHYSGVNILTKNLLEFDGIAPEKAERYVDSVEVKNDKDGNKVYCFPYKFNFQIKEAHGGARAEHLTYFVYAYMDLESFAQDQDFLDSSLLHKEAFQKKAVGEVSQQVVIQQGQVNNKNQVFYVTPRDNFGNPTSFPNLEDENGNIIGIDYSEARVWTGPIHYHGPEKPGPNGYIGYMAGNSGDDMGPFLTQGMISNNIVQDYRKHRDIQELNFDYSSFSNFWYNIDTVQRLLQDNVNNTSDLMQNGNRYAMRMQDRNQYISKSLSNSKNRSIFGDMYISMGDLGNTNFAFSFDVCEAIKQNTIFPLLASHLLKSGTQQSLNEIFSKKIIKDFKVYRHRVYDESPSDPAINLSKDIENEDLKLLVNTAELKAGILLAKTEKDPETLENIGAIKQINVDLPLQDQYNVHSVKFYTGTDFNTPNDGQYIYSVEISMNDPIISWIENRVKSLETILYGDGEQHSYKDYVMDVKKQPNFFNIHTNRFTEQGINHIGTKYGAAFSYDKIHQFFSILEKFAFFQNDQKKSDLFLFLSTISSLEYGSPTGVTTTFGSLENIYRSILDIYSAALKYKKPIDSQHVESKYAAGSNPAREYTIKHRFKSKVRGKINNLTGYDYLSTVDKIRENLPFINGLKHITATEYEQRVDLETSKLFPKKPTAIEASDDLGTNIGIYVGQTLINPEDSVDFSKYGYLSPSLINLSNFDSQNFINNGAMVTDVQSNNNTLLNIIRQNISDVQEYDFPISAVTTGARSLNSDSIISNNLGNELKYDATSIMGLNQATIQTREGKELLNSDIDAASLLLMVMQQKYFNSLTDLIWTWEYYTKATKKTILKEYDRWNQSDDIGHPYDSSNSPLKRAPNHVKALMLHLNPQKNLQNPAFDFLQNYLENTKPEAYDYSVKQSEDDSRNASEFFTVKLNDNQTKMVPKNKVIYQTPEFLSFFVLNYKKIVKIECLLGYNHNDINNPVWQELTQETWRILSRRSGSVICRMMPYEKELYGVKDYTFLNLPIYNDHFIINFAANEISDPQQPGEIVPVMEIIAGGERKIISPLKPTQSTSGVRLVLPEYNSKRSEDINQRVGSLQLQSIVSSAEVPEVTGMAPQPPIEQSNLSSGAAMTVSTPVGSGGSY